MKTINYYLEHPIRELDQAILLKIAFEKFNTHVRIYSGVYETNKSFVNSSVGAISPWGQGEHEYNYLFEKPEKYKNNYKKIILWQENILSIQNLPRILPRGRMINDVDAHITWGDKFANSLIEKGVQKEKIYICGSPRMDFLSPLFREIVKTKNDLSKEFNIPSNKHWLLFSGSFKLNFITKSIRKIKLNQGFHDLNKHIDYTQLLFNQSIDLLKEFSIKNPEFQIIIRPHPSEPFKVYENLFSGIKNAYIIKKYPIHHWINAVNLVFSTKSTSSLESYIMGTKAALIDLPEMDSGEKDTFDFLQYFPKANNSDELTRLFNKAIHQSNDEFHGVNNKILKNYIENGYGYTDGLNFLRVAYVISSIIKNSTTSVKNISSFVVIGGLVKDKIKKSILKYPYLGAIFYKSYFENRRHDFIQEKVFNESFNTISTHLEKKAFNYNTMSLVESQIGWKIKFS